jgi:hypothetical protein
LSALWKSETDMDQSRPPRQWLHRSLIARAALPG